MGFIIDKISMEPLGNKEEIGLSIEKRGEMTQFLLPQEPMCNFYYDKCVCKTMHLLQSLESRSGVVHVGFLCV